MAAEVASLSLQVKELRELLLGLEASRRARGLPAATKGYLQRAAGAEAPHRPPPELKAAKSPLKAVRLAPITSDAAPPSTPLRSLRPLGEAASSEARSGVQTGPRGGREVAAAPDAACTPAPACHHLLGARRSDAVTAGSPTPIRSSCVLAESERRAGAVLRGL